MKQLRIAATVVLAFFALGTSSADETWVVRADGVGPIRIGMTLEQLNKALEEKFTGPERKNEADCYYESMTKPPKLLLMMLEGRLARIEVKEPGVKTASGIQVGDSEAKAQKAYGARLKIEPHKYADNGRYLTVKTSDGRRGIRFETENGKITMYYAGRYDAIQFVEGCQ